MNKIKIVTILTVTGILLIGGSVLAKTGIVSNTSQGLVLRGSASKSGEPLSTVAEGTKVEILEEKDNWYKVNVDGKEGYLFAEYVKVQEEQASQNNESEVETNSADTAKVELKMHLLPVISSTTLETIPSEAEITIEKTVGNWSYITYGGVKGWVRATNVSTSETTETTPEEQPEEEHQEPEVKEEPKQEASKTSQEDTNVSFTKGYINSSSVNVRKEPSKSSAIITTLIQNTGVEITAQTEEWYKVKYGDYIGYIHKSLVSDKPTETQTTSSRSSEPRTAPETQTEETTSAAVPTSSSGSGTGSAIADFAKQYLGYSYTYGGTSPSTGFDCSGFAQYVYSSNGYSLSGRGASSQAQSGTAVSRDDLQPGDLLVFNNGGGGSIGHVGIYIGDGMMVHAANPKRGVVTDTINSGYYNTYYYSARRIAN